MRSALLTIALGVSLVAAMLFGASTGNARSLSISAVAIAPTDDAVGHNDIPISGHVHASGIHTVNVAIAWSKRGGALDQRVQLGPLHADAKGVIDADVSGTVGTLDPFTLYSFRIVVQDATGTATASSNTLNVRTHGSAPGVFTGPAIDQVANTVTLTGKVDTGAVAVDAYFEYGATDDYGLTTPIVVAGGESTVYKFSIVAPAKSFHYHLVADPAGGGTDPKYQLIGDDRSATITNFPDESSRPVVDAFPVDGTGLYGTQAALHLIYHPGGLASGSWGWESSVDGGAWGTPAPLSANGVPFTNSSTPDAFQATREPSTITIKPGHAYKVRAFVCCSRGKKVYSAPVSFTTPAVMPGVSVSTGPETMGIDNMGLLSGDVKGAFTSATQYHFDMGLAASDYDCAVSAAGAAQDTKLNASSHTVHVTNRANFECIRGWSTGKKVHYRLVASTINNGKLLVAYGGDRTISAPAQSGTTVGPDVRMFPIGDLRLTDTSVEISGEINSSAHISVEYAVDWGTTKAYGTSTPDIQTTLSTPYRNSSDLLLPFDGTPWFGEDSVALTQFTIPVYATITGLEPNTTYHFRIEAEEHGRAQPGYSNDVVVRTLPKPS